LLRPQYSLHGFKTADLLEALEPNFANSAQIRYELRKLIVRGVVEKLKGQSFYRVTATGWKWLWASITAKRFFKNPVISAALKKQVCKAAAQPSAIEQGFDMLDQGLSRITGELAMV